MINYDIISLFHHLHSQCITAILLSKARSRSHRPLLYSRLRVASSKGLVCSRCSSLLSMASASRASLNTVMEGSSEQQLLCKLCLCEVPLSATTCLQQCQCRFCTEVRQVIYIYKNTTCIEF